VNDLERLRLLDFLDQLRAPWTELFPRSSGDLTMLLVAHLVRAEIRGELVTVSALAQAGYAPYTTSMRRIDEMIAQKTILRVERSRTGKSFALKPSLQLRQDFDAYLKKIKTVLAATFGRRDDSEAPDSYYFGAPPASVVQRPPSMAREGRRTDMRFLLADDNYFTAMQNLWGDFRHDFGSRQDVELARLPQLYRLTLDNAQQPVSRYHLTALNIPWIGEFASKGLIRPIEDELSSLGLDPADFHDSFWAAGSYGGRQYGIPIYCTIETLAVRRDLLAEAGLPAPTSFDQVIDVGRHLHAPSHGRYGITWNAARGMPVAASFLFLLADCGEYLVPRSHAGDPDAVPHLPVEAGLRVLDYMHRLVEISPPDVTALDWESSFDIFLRGDAAMTYCWSMRCARFEYDTRSRVKRRVTYLPHPAGPHGCSTAPLGGFVLTIPVNLPQDQVRLAVEAMAWMMAPDSVRSHVKSGFPFLPRFSVVSDPEVMQSSPIVGFVEKVASRNMIDGWPRPPIPNYTAVEAIIGAEVHDALTRRKSDRAALAAIEEQVARLGGTPAARRPSRGPEIAVPRAGRARVPVELGAATLAAQKEGNSWNR
jgi:multiple sugar transport system substrate-binding protein